MWLAASHAWRSCTRRKTSLNGPSHFLRVPSLFLSKHLAQTIAKPFGRVRAITPYFRHCQARGESLGQKPATKLRTTLRTTPLEQVIHDVLKIRHKARKQ